MICAMEKILVSACLIGQKCTYKGEDNYASYLEELNEYYDFVPFCPEVEGGLPTPRPRSEIKGSQVITENGKTVTREFEAGAAKALEICRFLNIDKAILKENGWFDTDIRGQKRNSAGYWPGSYDDGANVTL